MNTKDLPAVCGFEPLVPGEEREIEGIFTGDLLSPEMPDVLRELSQSSDGFRIFGNFVGNLEDKEGAS